MSIANLTSAQAKEYLNLNINNMNIGGQLNVDALDVTNFVIGAIDSVNDYVPVVLSPNGSVLGATFNLKGGYAKKINNLVHCSCIWEVQATANGRGTFRVDKSNLPIAKVSDFTDLDRASGQLSASDQTVVKNGTIASDTSYPTSEIIFEIEGLTSGNTYQFSADFNYTTD